MVLPNYKRVCLCSFVEEYVITWPGLAVYIRPKLACCPSSISVFSPIGILLMSIIDAKGVGQEAIEGCDENLLYTHIW